MSQAHPINIIVLGRTGAGKSAFINYIIQKDVCPTGFGQPITQTFEKYAYPLNNGMLLHLYDSKGLSETDPAEEQTLLLNFLLKNCTSTDMRTWFHGIFYCVNVEAGSLAPFEVAFLQKLCCQIPQTLSIILTHCSPSADGQKACAAVIDTIRTQLPNCRLAIYPVNSIASQTRLGTITPFGRNEILIQMFDQLWFDVSRWIAQGYAAELYQGMHKMCDEADESFHKIQKRLDAYEQSTANPEPPIEMVLQSFQTSLQKIIQTLDDKYRRQIQPILELYSGSALAPRVQAIAGNSSFSFITQHFFTFGSDDLTKQNQKIQDLLNQSDALAETDTLSGKAKRLCLDWQLLATTIKMQHQIGKLSLETLRHAIPPQEQIAATVYDALLHAYQQ